MALKPTLYKPRSLCIYAHTCIFNYLFNNHITLIFRSEIGGLCCSVQIIYTIGSHIYGELFEHRPWFIFGDSYGFFFIDCSRINSRYHSISLLNVSESYVPEIHQTWTTFKIIFQFLQDFSVKNIKHPTYRALLSEIELFKGPQNTFF